MGNSWSSSNSISIMASLTVAAALASAVLVGVEGGKIEAVADFSDSKGIMKGEVVMNEGKFQYSLTIKEAEELQSKLKDTYSIECDLSDQAGLLYHVHTDWKYEDKVFGIGAECGPDYTGGHYKTLADPSEADVPTCSAECGEDGCNTKQTKLCEVGDLSGKDGPAEPKQKGRKLKFKGKFTKDKSLTEEVLEDFIGRSVVFHCASGARIFCAPIEVEM